MIVFEIFGNEIISHLISQQLFKNLYVYEGAEHPHEAQKPKEVKL